MNEELWHKPKDRPGMHCLGNRWGEIENRIEEVIFADTHAWVRNMNIYTFFIYIMLITNSSIKGHAAYWIPKMYLRASNTAQNNTS